jgi:hypothetical protein
MFSRLFGWQLKLATTWGCSKHKCRDAIKHVQAAQDAKQMRQPLDKPLLTFLERQVQTYPAAAPACTASDHVRCQQ